VVLRTAAGCITATAPPLGRRRGALLTSAIYRATLDELADTGFDKLSFDKIPASASTGKAARYRRWAHAVRAGP
jgi:hypothetical protein